jgi:hypothetical protein
MAFPHYDYFNLTDSNEERLFFSCDPIFDTVVVVGESTCSGS